MIRLILYITTTLLIFSCGIQTTLDLETEKWAIKSAKLNLGLIIDSSFTDSSSLSQLFNFKSINQSGKIKTITENEAIDIYLKSINNPKKATFPILETKDSKKGIILISGQGLWGPIWANILIEKESKKILKIKFNHKSETPGIGAKITDNKFLNQFNQLRILLVNNKIKFVKNDSSVFKVDAISGATITSNGVSKMIDEKLDGYKIYLR